MAVGVVVVFHSGASVSLPGGEVGVDLFMVLSGYLITTLLIGEWHARGSINIKDFYIRRALRLFPALILLLVAILVTAAVVDGGYQFTFSGNLLLSCLGALAYITDIAVGWGWWREMATDAPLLHTWSLSVEEHFYLLWAPLLAFLLRRMSVRALARVLLGLVVVVAAWSLVLDQVIGASTPRMIYSPDTRGVGLAVGAAMAAHAWTRQGRVALARILPWIALVAFLGLSTVGLMQEWAGRGLMLLVAIIAATMIAGVLDTQSAFARMWSLAPLKLIGRRAYGIYLWHFVVFHFVSADRFDLSPSELAVVKVLVTVVLVEFSYRLVEKPALKLRGSFTPRRVGPEPSDPYDPIAATSPGT
jgi:peptidoglycan/LPS O-acetylase OafA/YrhL